ncbi:MAG: hypothetical protein ACLQUY_22345 [Ktedonobacterales bacterium]
MLALATTRAVDVPLFCRALDGNASDKLSLIAAVETLAEQLHTEDAEAPIFVADSGLYSADNVARLAAAGVRWISRVPDTSTAARAALAVADDAWQQDGHAVVGTPPAGAGGERWSVVRTTQGEVRARHAPASGGDDLGAVGESAVAPGESGLRLRARCPGRPRYAPQETSPVAQGADPPRLPAQAEPSWTPA